MAMKKAKTVVEAKSAKPKKPKSKLEKPDIFRKPKKVRGFPVSVEPWEYLGQGRVAFRGKVVTVPSHPPVRGPARRIFSPVYDEFLRKLESDSSTNEPYSGPGESYEHALLKMYHEWPGNFYQWDFDLLELMFRVADPLTLRYDAGFPVVPEHPIEVYRGVAGADEHRHVMGMSWSFHQPAACRFAVLRRGLADPAVYKATITNTDILAVVGMWGEGEVIAVPKKVERLNLTMKEIRDGARFWKSYYTQRD